MKNYIISAIFLLLPVLVRAQETQVPALLINEVQVSNLDQYVDNALCYGSWIELYNPTSSAIPLRGMYLVVDGNEYRSQTAWGSIPAHSFKVLWFDHAPSQGNYGTNAKLQIPYKLEAEGGTISFLTSDRTLITTVSYPPAIPRCSWARTTDGGEEWGWTGETTPGASNNNSEFAETRLEAPQINTDSRVFSSPFQIRVRVPSGYTLRYTTDGSTPNATNGETSQNGRFTIDSTTIIRLRYFKEGFLPGPVATRSYIYQNHDYYLPILSVVSEAKNFFDNEMGVFVKGTNGISGNGQSTACNWNMDWERPVNIEYMVPVKTDDGLQTSSDGCTSYSMVLNQEMDLEICGGYTRAYGGGYVDGRYWEAKSSFRLKGDKRYEGVNTIDYPVFPSKPYNKYRCWQVRNGGNDTYARIKDPAIQMMVLKSGFYVDCQDYQPAHVFLNGLYYGMLNIRESNNKHYGYSNYGIDFDDMDQFDLSNAQYNQKIGTNEAWSQLLRLAQQLSQNQSAETYSQICDMLDIDEYVNYMALDCYMGPSDWITNTNNVKGFRSRMDGKFHFVLFDVESAFSSSTMLTDVLNTSGGASVDDLFRYLMSYDPFRRQFMDAYCIVDGSVFEPSRCEDIVWDIFQNINPALSFEGNNSSLSLINTVRTAHNGSRINTLRNYFNLNYSLYASLSANIPEARLAINGQEIPTGKFEGYLFSYNGQPIQLSAKAPAGYTFNGWITENSAKTTSALIPEGSQWMYYDQGSMDALDWKALSFNESANGWQAGTAPFGFAKEGYYMQENSVTKLDPTDQDSGMKRSTYYFRNTFHLDNSLSEEDVLVFNYQIDDGVMLYVNGFEIEGYYIASGSTYSDYTIDQHYEGQTPYVGSFIIPHEFLVVGENQIAVEVKNCHGTSSDIWFDGSLQFTYSINETALDSASQDLMEVYDNNSDISLVAMFSPVTDERQRWEMGASPLRINEVDAVGDVYINDYGKKTDWVELYNTTDSDISLAGLYFSDNPSDPQKYRFEDGVVPAHGTQIIWCDKKDAVTELHAPFKLTNADGAVVCIQAADGSWADQLQYMTHDKWQSFARYPDGGNMSTITGQPTINKSNKLGMIDYNALTDEDWLGPDRTITLELAEGWNWTSHNLAESVDKSRFINSALCLRGQEDSLSFSEEDGWQGTLEALEAAKGYKLRMQEATDVTLRGPIYDVNEPVILEEGWNWIGCPLYNATTIEAALANYVPREGDKIIGLDAFATYENGKWHGSLKAFSPGQAYLFYTSQLQVFCWNSLSPAKSRSRRYVASVQAEDDAWQTDIHAFPDVMTLVATVSADDGILLDEPYYVGAFCGDECRGVGVLEDGLLFMNIHGESEQNRITFRLLDSQGEVYVSSGYFRFQPCRQLGTVQQPCPLWFASQEIIDEIKPEVASAGKIRTVQYFNLSGQLINQPSQGVCIRKITYEDGSVKVSKLHF